MGHDEKNEKNTAGSIEIIFSYKSLSGKIYLCTKKEANTQSSYFRTF